MAARQRAKGGGRKSSPRLTPEACRIAIPGPSKQTATLLGVTRQAVEAVWKNGATVVQIDKWSKILEAQCNQK
jgi:hypothetical protein